MNLDDTVDYVHINEDGSGHLVLKGENPAWAFLVLPKLHYDWAPEDITALNGRPIRVGSAHIMCGDVKIATRDAANKITFIVEDFMRPILSLEDTPA